MSEKPKPLRYTTMEGGVWIDWQENSTRPGLPNSPVAHSIEFSDGSIFDMVNGWRREKEVASSLAIWTLEKVELAARRNQMFAFADEISKIIKDHHG